MFKYLREDMKQYCRGTVGFRKALQFLIDPRTQPVVFYRLASFFHRNRMGVIGRVFQFLNLFVYGCSISMKTEIGPGLIIRHGFGIMIGCEKIGSYFTVFPHVFIGTKTGEPREMEEQDVPVIGNHVTIYIGSKVFGKIRVGDNAVIAASSLVLKDVPEGATVGGIPAKILKSRQSSQ